MLEIGEKLLKNPFSFFAVHQKGSKSIFLERNTNFFVNDARFARKHFWVHSKLVGTPCINDIPINDENDKKKIVKLKDSSSEGSDYKKIKLPKDSQQFSQRPEFDTKQMMLKMQSCSKDNIIDITFLIKILFPVNKQGVPTCFEWRNYQNCKITILKKMPKQFVKLKWA